MKNNWLRLCVEIMNAGIIYRWGYIDTMRRFDILTPHAIDIIGYAYSEDCNNLSRNDDLVLLCNKVGYGLMYSEKHSMSLDCYKKALSLQENSLSCMSRYRAVLYHNISGLYEESGDFKSALEWSIKSLVINEAIHGKEGVPTAHICNTIGTIHRKQRNYKKAMNFYKRALYNLESEIGKDDISVSTVCNSIAVLFAEKKQFKQALKWHRRDLSICESLLKKDHPDIATSYNNIAMIYHDMGDSKTALEWYEKAIEIRYKVLGTEHPVLKTTFNNALSAYLATGGTVSEFEIWLNNVISQGKDCT